MANDHLNNEEKLYISMILVGFYRMFLVFASFPSVAP